MTVTPFAPLGVDDLARILTAPKNLLLNQFRNLVRFHDADLAFTDGAVREIARNALQRGLGARGLRSVVEEVLEPVLFGVEAGVRYVITEKRVRGGEAVKRSMTQAGAPLSSHLLRRMGGRNQARPTARQASAGIRP